MPKSSTKQPLTPVLLQAIADSGLTFLALERETGVIRQSLMKFAAGEQSLRLDMADKLAAFFGLELAPSKPPAARTGGTGRKAKRR